MLFAFKIFIVSAGCSYLPGGYNIVGNYTYDTANTTYLFSQGDTLLAIYNGQGSGTEYTELHYLNDSILLGSKLDTIKVYREGIYKVEFGCTGGTTLNATAKFSFTTPNSIAPLKEYEPKITAYLDKTLSKLFFSVGSTQIENFDIQIFDLQGKVLFKANNLLSRNEYSFTLNYLGYCIIEVRNKQGIFATKKVSLIQ